MWLPCKNFDRRRWFLNHCLLEEVRINRYVGFIFCGSWLRQLAATCRVYRPVSYDFIVAFVHNSKQYYSLIQRGCFKSLAFDFNLTHNPSDLTQPFRCFMSPNIKFISEWRRIWEEDQPLQEIKLPLAGFTKI